MKLSLTNFGCYDKAEFNFLDCGTVLLSAPSGKGKSTIIRAIVFALYGTGQKLVQYGKKKCKVELEYKNLHIARTKGPCRLVVTRDDGKIYEDDEAQTIIHQVVHHRSTHATTNFLSMSPSDKITFLESIIFDSVDITEIKTRIRVRIKECEQKLAAYEVEHDTVSKLLHELGSPETPVEEVVESEEEIKAHIQSLRTQKEVYQKRRQEIDQLRNRIQQLDSYIRADVEHMHALQTFDETRPTLIAYLDQIQHTKEYNRLTSELASEDATLDQLNATRVAIETRLAEYDPSHLTRLRNLKSALLTRTELMHQLGNVASVSPQEEMECKNEVDRLQRIAYESKHTYTCPECRCVLIMKNNVLKKAEHQDDPTNVEQEYYLALSNWNLLVGNKATRTHLTEQIAAIQLTIKTEGGGEWDDGKDSTMILEEVNRTIEKLEEQAQSLSGDRERLREVNRSIQRIQTNQQRLSNLTPPTYIPYTITQVQEMMVTLAEIDSHQKRIDCNQRERNLLQTELDSILHSNPSINGDCDDATEQTDETIRLLYQRIQQRQAYLTYVKMRDIRNRYISKISELSQNAAQQRSQLQCELEFRNKVNQAEATALSQLIHTINVHVQTYLDAFFEADPMQVTLDCSSNKPQIIVYYKGIQTDLSCLSTGEFDRVALAYSLSIQSILQQPIILLDECVSSLDQENADTVFHVITSFHRDKLVLLIAHQIVTGMFDQVVQL